MLDGYKIIDLTHELKEGISFWKGGGGFVKYDEDIDKFCIQNVHMDLGIGTHIDAPFHYFKQGSTVSELEIDQLLSPCVVIDVSGYVMVDTVISVKDICRFEESHGAINKGTFVLFYTGWGKRWERSLEYTNNYIFPCISKGVAQLLVKREVVGIGIDTLSPDPINSDFCVHKIILGANKYIIENIHNGDKMPQTGGYIMVCPLKIKSGAEAPVRLLGFVKK